MLCTSPVTLAGMQQYPCGKCMPCRVNRQREWAARLVLESLCHPRSAFVTLTYDREHEPPGGRLVRRDATLFLEEAA